VGVATDDVALSADRATNPTVTAALPQAVYLRFDARSMPNLSEESW
jgi:hypothetical protein